MDLKAIVGVCEDFARLNDETQAIVKDSVEENSLAAYDDEDSLTSAKEFLDELDDELDAADASLALERRIDDVGDDDDDFEDDDEEEDGEPEPGPDKPTEEAVPA